MKDIISYHDCSKLNDEMTHVYKRFKDRKKIHDSQCLSEDIKTPRILYFNFHVICIQPIKKPKNKRVI